MILHFNKVVLGTTYWEAEAQVNNNFNLHLDFKDTYQDITIYQKTTGLDFEETEHYDHHFGSLDTEVILGEVFPKIIKIKVSSEVAFGTITEIGDVPDHPLNTTTEELKSLRDMGRLTPGTWYRITDYNCTTIQEGTRSAGHRFDILVLATTESTLSENCLATFNDEDIHFKDNEVHIDAWKLKYCIDNDSTRFAWANSREVDAVMSVVSDNDKLYGYLYMGKEGNKHKWCYSNSYDNRQEKTDIQSEFEQMGYDVELDTEDIIYTDSQIPSDGEVLDMGGIEVRVVCSVSKPGSGKGVIYQMVDEWGNECPYDFKNILFRTTHDGEGNYDPDGDELYVYTFNWYNEDGECQDASILGNNGTLLNDEGQINGVYGNIIKPYYNYEDYLENPTNKQWLNNIIFISTYVYEGGIYYGCSSNTFGNGCSSNTFGNYCYSNTFGNGCSSNTFGNGCSSNTFGNDCYSNTFGNYCSSNTFGNDCSSNTFGNYCSSNTFGNGCSSNTFGNYCSSNTFGNGCYSNTFGQSKQALDNYFRYVTIESGVNNIFIHCSATTSGSKYCQNVHVNSGVNPYLTLVVAAAGNTFLTTFGSANDVKINY